MTKRKTETHAEHYARLRAVHNARDPVLGVVRRFRERLRAYGLTEADFRSMLDHQGGLCAVCRLENDTKRPLAIDHCHKTNKVRGLLCGRCNVVLGMARDSVAVLEGAIAYLKEHP